MKKNVRNYVFWIMMILMLMIGIAIYTSGTANAMEVSCVETKEGCLTVDPDVVIDYIRVMQKIDTFVTEIKNDPISYEYIETTYHEIVGGYGVSYWNLIDMTHCTKYFY